MLMTLGHGPTDGVVAARGFKSWGSVGSGQVVDVTGLARDRAWLEHEAEVTAWGGDDETVAGRALSEDPARALRGREVTGRGLGISVVDGLSFIHWGSTSMPEDANDTSKRGRYPATGRASLARRCRRVPGPCSARISGWWCSASDEAKAGHS